MTYANVAATIALFVSLGGVSYAAFSLPAGSVGSVQLRPSAVPVRALAFPLGAAGLTDYGAQDLTKNRCNSPLPSGVFAAPACPSTARGGLQGTNFSRLLHTTTTAPGRLVILATAGLRNAGAAGTNATVALGMSIDARSIGNRTVTLPGGSETQVPIEVIVDVPAGRHTIGFGEQADRYSSNGPGDVIVKPVSLIAAALPRP